MRWFSLLFLFPPLISTASSSQTPLISHPEPLSITILDQLYNDEDYLNLVQLLQKARLIPTLNRLTDATLFAPTNDAIKQQSLWTSILDDDSFTVTDNIQEQLRQQLFYHLINSSIPSESPDPAHPETLKTLHFPNPLLDFPPKEPPPWIPVPGGTLDGEPQRLRLLSRTAVGVNAFGKGGAEIVKPFVQADNGVIFGIGKVLEPPKDLASVIAEHSSVSYFHKILTPDIEKLLKVTPALTLFLPVDAAWNELDPYERLYLESEFATDDLQRILNMHAVVEAGVKWSDTFKSGLTLKTIDGTSLEIAVSPEQTKISQATLLKPDVYASNGVVHFVDTLLVPPGALRLTPEKYLLALKCTTFVSLLHSVDLTSLINDTESKYTILAPHNDVLNVFGDGELPERGSLELKKLLQYHFIPGKWAPSKLENRMLLETALEEEGLNGEKQVLAVELSSSEKKPGNEVEKSVRFGGASTIGEPIEVGNALIYFVSRPLVPPSDPLQTALPELELSSFLAAVFSTSQADLLRTTPKTSLLIPHNAAFKRLGSLASAHLLAASSKRDLENVILHHAIDSVEYGRAFRTGSQHTFSTLEGTDLQVERLANGSVYVSASGGWAGMKAELYPRDLLTRTGVVHELSDIMIPRTVELSVAKLVKAAKGSTWASLVVKGGFEWVLNGTSPPEGSPWADEHIEGDWTLLCPMDSAFKDTDLSKLYAEPEKLKSLITQHIILTPKPEEGSLIPVPKLPPFNNRPLFLDNAATYATLRSAFSSYGDIVFRQVDDAKSSYVVGVKGARGTNGAADSARVVAWGRSTTGRGTGGVIQIDQLLSPYQPPWWQEYGGPILVGVIGLVLECAFFYGIRVVWSWDVTEATYEPLGGFGQDDES